MPRDLLKPAAALAATLLLWASAFVGIRVAMRSFDSGAMALLRFLVASLAIAGWVLLHPGSRRRSWRIAPRDLPALLVLAVSGVTAYHVLLNAGERTVSAGSAALLIGTVPIWTVLLARLLLGERLEPRALIGIAIAFAGATWVSLGEGDELQWSAGALLVVAAAVVQGLFFTLQKRYLARYAVLPLTAWAIWLGTALLLPWAPRLASDLARAPLPAVLAVVLLGVFPSAIAYFTWAYVLARLPAARATTLLFLVPPVAVGMGWLLLGEAPGAAALGGGALAIAGVLLVQRRVPRPAGRSALPRPAPGVLPEPGAGERLPSAVRPTCEPCA